ncbi:MAG: DNA-binding protein, partial [Pseudodesulfovibrio sp.]|uniref:DNA-binding protein n=1 Tax=Pseudodesulfovibrio sp. TaxID=2035812 RepID=UPI003D0AACE2
MKDAYTTKELASQLAISRQALEKRAKREAWPSERRTGRGGGKVWKLKGLPQDVRTAITLREAEATVPALPDNNVVIPDWAHQVGMARFRLVSEWRQFVDKSKSTKGRATKAFVLAVNAC